MDGSTTTDHCYSWSCNNGCLFQGDELVCCKVNGILLSREKYIKYLKEPFEKLDIHSYVFEKSPTEYEELIHKALLRFYECATKAECLDEVILTLIQKLNIKYENKYLDYCRKLSIDQFREVAKKHNSRKPVAKVRTFTGIWYK